MAIQRHDFGDLVRRYRESAGLTQEGLAERARLSVRAVGDIERGRTGRPRRSSVRLLAMALRLTGADRDRFTAIAYQPDQGAADCQPVQNAAGQNMADRDGAELPCRVPRQLPGSVAHFVGREAELATLTSLLEKLGSAGGAVVISAVGGTAGVGKTTLAVHWAHLIKHRFPDGQLYVNLRGYDPGQPVTAADALAGFLRALGVPGRDIPPTGDERAAQYRSLLAGRRMLVVLDNAGHADQVRPLLPGTSSCATVVTSRDSLAGLVARDDAVRLDLDPLSVPDAVGLLRALIGQRVDADTAAAAELAAQCCRLPLTLRVAAEIVAARPAICLADLVCELADQQRRLDLLDPADDPSTGVRAVFSWSCRNLHGETASAFRLLGLHPGAGLDRYAAAALTGTSARQAGHTLQQLARAHLIQETRHGRYSMHDLLAAYARELVSGRQCEAEREAALTRLFDYYLHTAAVAMDTLYPAERHRRPQIPAAATPAAPVTDGLAAARDWLDAERSSLVAIAARAERGWPVHASRLSAILFRYLEVGAHYTEAAAIHACARRAARRCGDLAAEAGALVSLGLVEIWQCRYRQAVGHLRHGLAVCRQTGDRTGEARALLNLGLADIQRGRYGQAAVQCQQALALYREIGDRTGETRALRNLGLLDQRQGRYQRATEALQQALAVCRQTDDLNGEAHCLDILGDLYRKQRRYRQAEREYRQALALYRQIGDRPGQGHVLADLGNVCLRLGWYQQAEDYCWQALALLREIGDRSGLVDSLNALGEVLLATGQPGPARARLDAALSLAGQIGDKYEQARAHNNLAHCHRADDDPGRARQHWRAALALYAGLAAPEADEVRAQLDRVPSIDRTRPSRSG